MRRLAVGLAGLLALGLPWSPAGVDAQSARKIPRVGVLTGSLPSTPSQRQPFLDALGWLGALRVQVQFLDPQNPDGLDGAFVAARSGRAEAVLVPDVAWFGPSILQRIADLATKSRLPAISAFRPFAVFGGLASYGPRPGQAPPRVLAYMDRILKGAKPGDLPVEQRRSSSWSSM